MPLAGARTVDVGADTADGDELADPVGVVDGEVDPDAAAHRVADYVDPLEPEGIDERRDRALRVEHGVTAEVVTDPEAGELQHQAVEVLGEDAQVAPKLRHPVTRGPSRAGAAGRGRCRPRGSAARPCRC